MTLTPRDPLHTMPCWKQTHFIRPWWLGAHCPCPWWQGTKFMKMLTEILSVYLSTSRSTPNTRVIPNICLPTIPVRVYISFELLQLKRHNRMSQLTHGLRIQEVPCSNIVIRSSLQLLPNFCNPSWKMAGNILQIPRTIPHIPRYIIH